MSAHDEPLDKPKPDFWTATDKAVLGLCETLALLFSLPFGEDLYHNTPITGWHVAYLVIGLVFAVIGPMWPYIRTQPWFSQNLSAAISGIAVDPRVWLGVILLLFWYLAGPELYQRATNQTTSDDAALRSQLATANQRAASLQSQLDAATKDRDSVRQTAQPPSPEDQSPIAWQDEFQWNWESGPKMAWIRFVGHATALAQIKDAYIISDLTGHKEQLSVANPLNFSERWNINEIEPVSNGAPISLIYEIQPTLSVSDFLSIWGAFELHVVYDDKEYVKKYSSEYINGKIAREIPGSVGPRVTKKTPDK